MPKEELGLANFKHIHNAVLRQYGNKLYVIAQAWSRLRTEVCGGALVAVRPTAPVSGSEGLKPIPSSLR
jgi:hypothetical protein